jgi:hypothetical protein
LFDVLAEQHDEYVAERRKSKTPHREKLPIADLLEADKDYENEFMCWKLAQGNYAAFTRLYEELPASEVFRLNMLQMTLEYYNG